MKTILMLMAHFLAISVEIYQQAYSLCIIYCDDLQSRGELFRGTPMLLTEVSLPVSLFFHFLTSEMCDTAVLRSATLRRHAAIVTVLD